MVDNVDRATRSRYMSAVKSRGNRSTELRMAKLLRRHGLTGWRRHHPVPGTPDFCWPKLKLALFVDGCFWHGCPRCRRAPKSRVAFWNGKVSENRRRDRRADRALRKLGWSVIRVWECQIGAPATVIRLQRAVRNRGRPD